MDKPRGVVLYDGPSMLDGKPIVVIATLNQKNPKTGDLIQTWILLKNKHPMEAKRSGKDSSICGDCVLRGLIKRDADGNLQNVRRGCYVLVQNAPSNIWKSYKRGAYPVYNPSEHADLFRGRKLRFGSYGDPTAAPMTCWRPILKLVSGSVGYTHQWRQKRFRHWSKWLMASVHTPEQAAEARAMGWRYFRTRQASQPLGAGEFVCPASAERGKKLTCSQCMACNGGAASKASPVIIAHGGSAVMAGYNEMMAA